MNVMQTTASLRARRRLLVLTMAVSSVLAMCATLLHEKNYQATATLVLNYKGIDPVSGRPLPLQMLPNVMATQVDIFSSKTVALKVVDDLRLTENAAYQSDFKDASPADGNLRVWIAERLLKKLDVMPSRESNALNISFSSPSADEAATVANAFVHAGRQVAVRMRLDPLQAASAYFGEQLKTLRDGVAVAQLKLSQYQQAHGIVSVDSRLDVETTRLNELSSQMVNAQAQQVENNARQRRAGGNTASPDVLAHPLVQSRMLALANAQARLNELAQRLGKNHPAYQAAQTEVASLSSELAQQTRQVAGGVAGAAQISRERELELGKAVAQQKVVVLDLNRARDEAALLTRELDNAQKAYDLAAQRLAQTSLEGQANQSDATLLTPAMAPAEPTGLKWWQLGLLSLLFGFATGCVFALVSEYRDRRVRSAGDMTEVLCAPFLGTVGLDPAALPIADGAGILRLRRIFGS